MSRDELVERFTLERVGKSAAVFDYDKLKHLNGVYLRALPPEEYADRLVAYLRERGYEWDEQLIRRAAPLVQEKIETLGEFPAFAGFLFARVEPESAVRRRGATAAAEALAQVEPLEAGEIEATLRGWPSGSGSSRATRFSRFAWP
jgi:glutamyl-tRNA synthetase